MSPEQVRKLVEPLLPVIAVWAVRLLGALLFLWISVRLAGWAGKRVTRSLESRNFDAALSRFFGAMLRYALMAAAMLACLSLFGIQTTSFAALIGSAGLAVGLAFQGTLANFASGVLLLVFRPFDIGDYVSVKGVTGTVVEIGLFTCSFDTVDNRHLIVPNKEVFGATMENVTHHDKRRVDIDVGVDYSADVDEVRKVLDAAATKIPGRLEDDGHQIFLAGLGGSSVDWQVRVWCKTEDYWDVWQATIQHVKEGLDEAGIGIPYPTMDVNTKAAE